MKKILLAGAAAAAFLTTSVTIAQTTDNDTGTGITSVTGTGIGSRTGATTTDIDSEQGMNSTGGNTNPMQANRRDNDADTSWQGAGERG